MPVDILLDLIVKFHFSILGFTDNYSNDVCNVSSWPDYDKLSVRCVSLSVASVRSQQIYLSYSSALYGWCVSIIYSYGLKLFSSIFQQDFLLILFSRITKPSFPPIQLLLKVLQPVVVRCLVAPSESHPLHRVMENNTVSCCNLLREPLPSFLCFCDEKGISNLAIVLVYQPDLCLERLRKITTPPPSPSVTSLT